MTAFFLDRQKVLCRTVLRVLPLMCCLAFLLLSCKPSPGGDPVTTTTTTAAGDKDVLANGNFESGRNVGWTEYSKKGYAVIGTGTFFASTDIQPAVTPRTGTWMGRIGGFSYEVNSISQTVTVPNTTPMYLAFYAQTRSAETSECAGLWVGAEVSIAINDAIVFSSYLCQYNDLYDWTLYFIDMSTIAGHSAKIVFSAEAASSVWSFLYLDDISITPEGPAGDMSTEGTLLETAWE